MARRKSLGESLLEAGNVIVCVCVWETTAQVIDFHEGILRTHLDHAVGMRHCLDALRRHITEHVIEFFLRHSLICSRVDPCDESLGLAERVVYGVILFIGVVHRNARPSLFDECVGDGDSISSMSVGFFIGTTSAFEHDDCACWCLWLWEERGESICSGLLWLCWGYCRVRWLVFHCRGF